MAGAKDQRETRSRKRCEEKIKEGGRKGEGVVRVTLEVAMSSPEAKATESDKATDGLRVGSAKTRA